jgi:DnaJ-class molecular chaperone
MAKNYYRILGVAVDAPPKEIKTAYREQARALHPDTSGRESGDEFLELQEAYAALSDPARRRDYDRMMQVARTRSVRRRAPEPLIPEEQHVEPLTAHPGDDLGEISLARSFSTYVPSFDQIFDYLWRNFSSLDPPKAEGVRSLGVEVTLSTEEARRGGHARILVPAHAVCPTCRGRGAVSVYECWRCAGEGAISGELPVTISFPAGTRDRHAVELSLSHLGISNCYLTVLFRVTDQIG